MSSAETTGGTSEYDLGPITEQFKAAWKLAYLSQEEPTQDHFTVGWLVDIYSKAGILPVKELWRLSTEACEVIQAEDALGSMMDGFNVRLIPVQADVN